MPLLENTCLFLLNFYKRSGLEKISITMKIDKISLRVTEHQAKQVRKYTISLNKIKHLENEQKRFLHRVNSPNFSLELTFQKIFLPIIAKKVGEGDYSP